MSTLRDLVVIALLTLAAPASAVTVDWVSVADPGNPCINIPPQGCRGRVDYIYEISKFEITNAQYAEMLNAIAATDTYLLYNTLMETRERGGITRSGSPGTYSYTVKPGRENQPVNYVSYHSALRFANWLNNGQPSGAQDRTTTEDGSYTFVDRTTVGPRKAAANIVLPNDDEWIKAAYYRSRSSTYNFYPAATGAVGCAPPTTEPNRANCASDGPVEVGSYPNTPSPYGTFDQGGNVGEWSEPVDGMRISRRGGAYSGGPNSTLITARDQSSDGNVVGDFFGFRIARVPQAIAPVSIDIRPGSELNPINPLSRGVIPVAILGSDTFDVADVDVTTLVLFAEGAEEGAAPAHKQGGHLEDVNDDGITDLLSHYGSQDTGIVEGDTTACVEGELLDGTPFKGCDSILVLGSCGIGFELALVLPPLMWVHRRRKPRVA